MRNLDRIEQARQALTNAINRSTAGDTTTRSPHTLTFEAELTLRQAGRRDLAARLQRALDDDVTTTAGRQDVREVIQLLDAELEPSVSTASFATASDGGVDR